MDNNKDRQLEIGRTKALTTMIAVVGAVVMLLIFFSSCSPRIVEHVRYQHDTTYVEKIQIDSVWNRDSVFVHEKGDTVYIYKEKIRNKYKFLRDTIRASKVDSVYVDRVKEVKIEKKLNWIQKIKLGSFWFFFAGFALLLVWTFRKLIFKI